MCIDDWRLGRLMRSQITSINPGVAGIVSIPASRQRVGVTVSLGSVMSTAGTFVQLSIDGLIWGFMLVNPPIQRFTLKDDGDLVTKSFSALVGSASCIVCFTELFLPEGILSEPIDANRREY